MSPYLSHYIIIVHHQLLNVVPRTFITPLLLKIYHQHFIKKIQKNCLVLIYFSWRVKVVMRIGNISKLSKKNAVMSPWTPSQLSNPLISKGEVGLSR